MISAPKAKSAAVPKAVDTPEVSTCAGSPLALRVAVPYTVTRIDRPSEPPTCCIALSTPEAAPLSAGSTPETPIMVRA
ncbi:hypothetical protein ACFQ3Z_43205 [Streptomyces nogalater]